MSLPVAKIEARLEEILGRSVVWTPSGRFALYLALTRLVPPGSSICLSPVVCDAVLTIVLAAGLRPLFGPVDPKSGNLDADAIPEGARRKAGSVLATNLYGVPDRTDALARGFPIVIDDACQAFDSRAGACAPVSAFSFAKHLGLESGGALAFADRSLRPGFERARDALVVDPSGRARLRGLARALRIPSPLRRLAGTAVPSRTNGGRRGHRVEYDPARLAEAASRAPSLDAFDRWLRVDHPRHRERPVPGEVASVAAALDRVEAESRLRIEGTRRIAALGLTPPEVVEAGRTRALYRVPLLVRDRDALREALVSLGITVNCIYDPPLHACIEPALFERCGVGTDGALLWSRHVLPVDPLQADRVVEVLGRPGVPRAEPALS